LAEETNRQIKPKTTKKWHYGWKWCWNIFHQWRICVI